MKPDEIRAIWIMQLSMKNFHDFLKGFQPKISYIPWSRIRTQKFAPFFTSSAEGEAILYDTNFRRVQQIGKPILTSNIVHPWPSWHAIPTLKETAKHPREVIPAVYQVLMDLILGICWYNKPFPLSKPASSSPFSRCATSVLAATNPVEPRYMLQP